MFLLFIIGEVMVLCRLDSSCISVCKMQLFTYLFVLGSVCVTALWKIKVKCHFIGYCCVVCMLIVEVGMMGTIISAMVYTTVV